jgi:hypothetical protein
VTASRPARRQQRLALLLELGRKDAANGARLHSHHADRVADYVVEFARDARALSRDGLASAPFLLLLERLDTGPEYVRLVAHHAHRTPDRQRGDRKQAPKRRAACVVLHSTERGVGHRGHHAADQRLCIRAVFAE